MSVIINRMRWLSAGLYLGMFIVYLMESYSEDDDKKIDLTQNWSNYKHNHTNKETTNA
jgi:hypothetical protein